MKPILSLTNGKIIENTSNKLSINYDVKSNYSFEDLDLKNQKKLLKCESCGFGNVFGIICFCELEKCCYE